MQKNIKKGFRRNIKRAKLINKKNSKQCSDKDNSIEVVGMSHKLKTNLFNISDNKGIPLSHILKSECKKIIASFPDDMRVNQVVKKKVSALRITNMTPQMQLDLINISDNLNVPLSSFLKIMFYYFEIDQPLHLKKEITS